MPRRCILLACLLLTATGCPSSTSPPPLVLGHVANRSGLDSAGQHTAHGISLALKQATDDNLADALNGRALEVRHTDTRGQLPSYESEAVRLVNVNRVIGLLGGTTPDEVERLDKAHVPLLAFTGVRPPGVSELTFTLGMQPAAQAFILARLATEDLHLAELVVLADDRREPFVTVADLFCRAFVAAQPAKANGALTPVRFSKDTNWDELAKTHGLRNAKAVVFAGQPGDWAALRQRLPTSLTVLFAGDDGAQTELQRTDGTTAIYFATAFVADPAAPHTQTFVRQYRAGFKTEPDVHAALGYEALQLFAEALKQSSPAFTQDKLHEALQAIKDFPGLAGPLTMTDQRLARPLYAARLEGGVPKLLKRYEPATLP